MIAVIERINSARVYADGILTADVGKGLYILLGVSEEDGEQDALVLAEKIAKLRIFSDSLGKMNLSVEDIGGSCAVVSNFTLLANYKHGNRPDYLSAAKPTIASRLYELFVQELKKRVKNVQTGKFGADMRSEKSTDGPVTIVMDSKLLIKAR